MADATVKLGLDNSEFKRGLADAKSAFGDFGKQALGMAAGFGVYEVVSKGLNLFSDALKTAVKEAAEAEQVNARLNATLETSGKGFKGAAEYIDDFANKLQETTAVADDVTKATVAMFLQFGYGVEKSKQLTELAVNMKGSFGGVESAARLLMRAMDGDVEVFKKYNIVAKDSNDLMDQLNQKFSGKAAAEMDTYAGKVEQFKRSWEDFAKSLGDRVLPVLSSVMSNMASLLKPTSEDFELKALQEKYDNPNFGSEWLISEGLYDRYRELRKKAEEKAAALKQAEDIAKGGEYGPQLETDADKQRRMARTKEEEAARQKAAEAAAKIADEALKEKQHVRDTMAYRLQIVQAGLAAIAQAETENTLLGKQNLRLRQKAILDAYLNQDVSGVIQYSEPIGPQNLPFSELHQDPFWYEGVQADEYELSKQRIENEQDIAAERMKQEERAHREELRRIEEERRARISMAASYINAISQAISGDTKGAVMSLVSAYGNTTEYGAIIDAALGLIQTMESEGYMSGVDLSNMTDTRNYIQRVTPGTKTYNAKSASQAMFTPFIEWGPQGAQTAGGKLRGALKDLFAETFDIDRMDDVEVVLTDAAHELYQTWAEALMGEKVGQGGAEIIAEAFDDLDLAYRDQMEVMGFLISKTQDLTIELGMMSIAWTTLTKDATLSTKQLYDTFDLYKTAFDMQNARTDAEKRLRVAAEKGDKVAGEKAYQDLWAIKAQEKAWQDAQIEKMRKDGATQEEIDARLTDLKGPAQATADNTAETNRILRSMNDVPVDGPHQGRFNYFPSYHGGKLGPNEEMARVRKDEWIIPPEKFRYAQQLMGMKPQGDTYQITINGAVGSQREVTRYIEHGLKTSRARRW